MFNKIISSNSNILTVSQIKENVFKLSDNNTKFDSDELFQRFNEELCIKVINVIYEDNNDNSIFEWQLPEKQSSITTITCKNGELFGISFTSQILINEIDLQFANSKIHFNNEPDFKKLKEHSMNTFAQQFKLDEGTEYVKNLEQPVSTFKKWNTLNLSFNANCPNEQTKQLVTIIEYFDYICQNDLKKFLSKQLNTTLQTLEKYQYVQDYEYKNK